MTRYLVQPRYRIFAKAYGFLSSTEKTSKKIGENTNKKMSGNYSQNNPW